MIRKTLSPVIRPIAREDMAAIGAIESAFSPRPWSAAMLERERAQSDSVNAAAVIESSTIAGFVFGKRAADELEVYKLAVHAGYRRLGIGEKLMRYIIDTARSLQLKAIYLEVGQSNNAAISLYEKLGFAQTGMRKGYYRRNGDNAVLMCYNVSDSKR